MSGRPFAPRINHVAISVDAELMDDAGRAALLDFFSEVFGWTEGDNSTEKGNPLILYTGALGQFLYLLPAKDEFMVTPNMDHFGMEVSSMEEMVRDPRAGQGLQGQGRPGPRHRGRRHGDAATGRRSTRSPTPTSGS